MIKLSGINGGALWRQEINGTANQWDQALAVAVDAANDVVAAGRLRNTDTQDDFAVIKLSGGNGAERWRRLIDGSAHGVDEARAVQVDAAGDVIAAGYLRNQGTREDFTVVKLTGSDGTERWRREINGAAPNGYDEASAITLDAAGDVVAVGLLASPGNNTDFGVTKLSGLAGTEQGRWVTNGSAR